MVTIAPNEMQIYLISLLPSPNTMVRYEIDVILPIVSLKCTKEFFADISHNAHYWKKVLDRSDS